MPMLPRSGVGPGLTLLRLVTRGLVGGSGSNLHAATGLTATFDDGRLPTWLTLANTSALASVAYVRGRVEISPPVSASGVNYGVITTRQYYDFTGCSATLEVSQLLTASLANADSGFALIIDANNRYDFLVSGTTILCRQRFGGVTTTAGSFTWTAATTRFLRLRHTSTTFYWDTSPDGLTWTTQASHAADVNVATARIEINAGTFAADATPGVFIVDNLNVVPHVRDQHDGFDTAGAPSATRWQVTTSGGATATQSSGQLRLNLPTTGTASAAIQTWTTALNLTDQRATVNAASLAGGAATSLLFLLVRDSPLGNAFGIQFSYNANTLQARHTIAGVSSFVGSTLTYDATQHRWLGIRERLGTIYYETSPDGVTWTAFASEAAPLAVGGLGIYLSASVSGASAGATHYALDHLNLTPSRPVIRRDTARRTFKVKLYEPLGSALQGTPLADMDINPDITAMKWSHALPGGPNGLTVGFADQGEAHYGGPHYGRLPDPIRCKPFAHVEVWAGGLLVWDGRVQKLDSQIGRVTAFTAVGYATAAMSDFPYQNPSTTLATSGTILADAIQQAAPALALGDDEQFIDPLTLHAPVEYYNALPSAMAAQFGKEGGTSNVIWDFYLLPGRIVCFRPRTTEQADYVVTVTDTARLIYDYSAAYAGAVVTYTKNNVAFNTPITLADDFIDDYGILRATVVSADEHSDAGALQLLATTVQTVQQPKMTATLRLGADDWLTTYAGHAAPAWAAQAGEWMTFGQTGPLPITAITVDARTLAIQITCGEATPASWGEYVKELRRVAAMLAANQNPLTGGRKGRISQQAAVIALVDSTGGIVDRTLTQPVALTDSTGGTPTATLTATASAPGASLTDSTGGTVSTTLGALPSASAPPSTSTLASQTAPTALGSMSTTATLAAYSAPGHLTNSTAGTVNGVLEAISATFTASEHRNNYSELYTKLTEVQDDLATYVGSIRTVVNNIISDKEGDLSAVKTAVDSHKTRYDASTANIVAKVNAVTTSYDGQFGTVQSDINALRAPVHNDVASLAAVVNGHRSAITSSQTETRNNAATLNSQINTVRAAYAGNFADLAAHTGDVAARLQTAYITA